MKFVHGIDGMARAGRLRLDQIEKYGSGWLLFIENDKAKMEG